MWVFETIIYCILYSEHYFQEQNKLRRLLDNFQKSEQIFVKAQEDSKKLSKKRKIFDVQKEIEVPPSWPWDHHSRGVHQNQDCGSASSAAAPDSASDPVPILSEYAAGLKSSMNQECCKWLMCHVAEWSSILFRISMKKKGMQQECLQYYDDIVCALENNIKKHSSSSNLGDLFIFQSMYKVTKGPENQIWSDR